jgi:5-methylcytosine-specific restriction endonuclease McrA
MRSPLCEGCNAVVAGQHVDHIVPLDQGGAAYDPANLQVLCIACHNAKTKAEQAGKQWIKPKDRGCDVDGAPRSAQS